MNLNTRFRSTAALGVLLAALAISGCSDGGNDDGGTTGGGTTGGTSGGTTGGVTGGTTGGAGATGDLYISFDAGGDAGSTDVYSSDLSTRRSTFNTGLNEGIVAFNGTLNAVGVIAGVATLRQISNFPDRGGMAYNAELDDEVMFPTFREPKGIALAGVTRNQLIVGDAAAAEPGTDLPSLHLLTTLVGLANPRVVADIPESLAGGRTWDVAYDGTTDRLYAAMTNGTVAVYDTFTVRGTLAGVGGPLPAPSRTITPGRVSGGQSSQVSVNLHGVSYDRASDSLVLSDVGMAASDSDGALFVIANASTASDVATGTGPAIVQPARMIAGPATRLGNPVDILLRDGNLFVAEKINGGGQILRFNAIVTATGSGDIAPNQAVTTASLNSVGGPESITNAD